MGQWINDMTQNEWGAWWPNTAKVRWPHVDDERGSRSNWFTNSGPDIEPMLVRLVTRFFYALGTGPVLQAYFELEGIDEDLSSDVTDVNALGQTLGCTLRNWRLPHPVFGNEGVSWTWVYHRDGFADDVTSEIFLPRVNVNWDYVPFWWYGIEGVNHPNYFRWTTTYAVGQDTDWTALESQHYNDIHWHAIPWGRDVPQNPELSPYFVAP